MESGDDFQRLRAENEKLTIQLLDLDALISAREDELGLLRKMAEEGRRIRSDLDMGLHEVEQMRQALDEARIKAKRAESLQEQTDKELIDAINAEKRQLELLDKSASMKVEIEVLQNELMEATVFQEKIKYLESRLAELSSRLEIAEFDRDALRLELKELRSGEGGSITEFTNEDFSKPV